MGDSGLFKLLPQVNNPKYIVVKGPLARSRIKACCENWASSLDVGRIEMSGGFDMRVSPEYHYRVKCHFCGCDSGNHPTFDLAVMAWNDEVQFREVLKAL